MGDRKSYQANSGGNQKYVGAPYNFISFYDKPYQYPTGKLTDHDSMEENLVTGEISYEVTAETPVMIDDGTGHFYRDAKGRSAIPGSTMRGLIRNNVQVLGLCGYEEDIDDYTLMYRTVAYGAEKARYNNILGAKQLVLRDGNKSYRFSVLQNVQAGYVSNEGGEYVIYQTKIDSVDRDFHKMNYYVLSERKIINDYLKHGDRFSYGFFLQKGRSILQHEFRAFSRSERDGRVDYKETPNDEYHPYYLPVSYEVSHGKDVTAVGYPGEYKNQGYAVSTGRMNKKKAVYIIPEVDKGKDSLRIPDEDVRVFRIDMKKRENSLKQFGGKQCFDLPEEGEMRPVFYIRSGDRLYFGFTPRLRLFYDHSVKEGLKQIGKAGGVDYAKALFGYASPEKSYKSKLSFSDAVLQNDAGCGAERKLILAEPKPSSYLDYLKQDGKAEKTYNTDGFQLRGAKQYWLHKAPVAEAFGGNDIMASAIRPLAAGAKFAGKIRFWNLTEDELGLLLWAVRLNEGSQMNVGKAKSYGYGRISVRITKAGKLDMQRAYQSEELAADPFCGIEIDQAIECYKEEINRYLGSRTIDRLPHIQEFFLMKDSRRIPEDGKTRYMNINAREYQSRKAALPEIRSVVKPE
ncbi:MAG: TIGR03986 family CRISPR-associated RAMP protein [Firmicutes bacterium]|nr:TIGR03986 family CRISPR-associated RAMP protein [Bacillota bacterium]